MTEEEFRNHMKLVSIPKGFIGKFKYQKHARGTSSLVFALVKADDMEIQFTKSGYCLTQFVTSNGEWRSLPENTKWSEQGRLDLNRAIAAQRKIVARRRNASKQATSP